MSAVLEVRREPKARKECVGQVAEAGASEPEDGCCSDALIAPFGRGLLKMSGDGDWKDVRGCNDWGCRDLCSVMTGKTSSSDCDDGCSQTAAGVDDDQSELVRIGAGCDPDEEAVTGAGVEGSRTGSPVLMESGGSASLPLAAAAADKLNEERSLAK
jgi:hypothetical protein